MNNDFNNTAIPVETIREIKEQYEMEALPEDGSVTWGVLYFVRLLSLANNDPVIRIILKEALDKEVMTPEEFVEFRKWLMDE